VTERNKDGISQQPSRQPSAARPLGGEKRVEVALATACVAIVRPRNFSGAIQAVAPSFDVEWRPIDPSDAGTMERAISIRS
jgi:hypothetical protein